MSKTPVIDKQKITRLLHSIDPLFYERLGDIDKIQVDNPLDTMWLQEQPTLMFAEYLSDPANFGFLCKWILNIQLLPYQLVILQEMWTHRFPMLITARGGAKTYLLAVYCLIKCLLNTEHKVVVVGSGFRQSRFVYEYCESIWSKAPVLRSMFQSGKNGPYRDIDRCTFFLGTSTATFIPIGTGEKIRGLRANTIISDEFAAIALEVYEVVISGFGAVSSSPVENVIAAARRKLIEKLGFDIDFDEATADINQSIISGTAYYDFNHFADYWKRYKAIIKSQGDQYKLRESLKGEPDDRLNWKDFCVIRIPVELLPEGFMSQSTLGRSRATMHKGHYEIEYEACFAKDSLGFFKRSLLESCVTNPASPIKTPAGTDVHFKALLSGNKDCTYVMGVDPASEVDNFCIVILEIHPDHNRIVYCWTTDRHRFKEKLKIGLIKDKDYYGYCARKIRELMYLFSMERIGMDSQGGARAVMEALQDDYRLEESEEPIFEVIDPDPKKREDTDHMKGLHIVELVNFASYQWTSEANHGLRKDFEEHALLFPFFDSLSLELEVEQDSARLQHKADEEGIPIEKLYEVAGIYDTVEDCLMEIEYLKDELSTIIMTKTEIANIDRWTTPEVKLPGHKKGRLTKDRYSSLLIANMVSRCVKRGPVPVNFDPVGNWAKSQHGKTQGDMYDGPDWYRNFYVGSVSRRG